MRGFLRVLIWKGMQLYNWRLNLLTVMLQSSILVSMQWGLPQQTVNSSSCIRILSKKISSCNITISISNDILTLNKQKKEQDQTSSYTYSSRHANIKESHDSFLLSVLIGHCYWQIVLTVSSVCTLLMNVSFYWSTVISSRWMIHREEWVLNIFIQHRYQVPMDTCKNDTV